MQIDSFSNEEQAKTLTKEVVTNMINEWLADYKIFTPSQLFMEFPEKF